MAGMRVVVKNTFLELLEDDGVAMPLRRWRSVPTLSCVDHGALSKPIALQIERLTDVFARGTPRQAESTKSTSDAPTRPSTDDSSETYGVRVPSEATVGSERCDDVLTTIPLDSRGRLMSIGSRGHAAGSCTPCAYVGSSRGCKFSVACDFCHFVDEHAPKTASRPCKAKRMRIKRAMAAIEERVAENPDVLSGGDFRLPPLLEQNPRTRARAMAQISEVAASSYRSVTERHTRH